MNDTNDIDDKRYAAKCLVIDQVSEIIIFEKKFLHALQLNYQSSHYYKYDGYDDEMI